YSSRRRHTRSKRDWSSDVCSSDLNVATLGWKSDVVNEALRTATERAEYFLYGMNKGKELDVDDPDLDTIEFGDSVEELADKDPTVVEVPLGQATGNTV